MIGCTDYSPSVFVRQAQLLNPEDDCLVENDPSSTAIYSGRYDPAIGTNGYFGALLVGNQLIPRGDEEQLKPEANRVQFYEAEVELLSQSGDSMGAAFFQTISGFADPSRGTEPGYGVAGVTLIPPGTAATGTVVARIIVRGVTLGGEDVETAFWDFPILVAPMDCLEPASCDDELVVQCVPGQDTPPDCRLTGQSACP
ncbi:MAG TPA: hypothetical protein VFB62_27520 [Polyangiaceae bacterium]|nr:hypothetical protein [Polyangiaceae bacterium]